MLERIYASKMFAASKNQDKITKALVDPLNGELVQQLRSYLDDDFLKEAKEHREAVQPSEPKEPFSRESSSRSDRDNRTPAPERTHDSSNPSPRHSSSSDFSRLSDMGVPDANEGATFDEEKSEELSDTSETQTSEDASDEISESVDILSDVTCRIDTDEIERCLNENEQSAGVRRVTLSGSELWIYYKDDINLNSVMDATISKVTEICSNWKFSRFARTYNAIVFSSDL